MILKRKYLNCKVKSKNDGNVRKQCERIMNWDVEYAKLDSQKGRVDIITTLTDVQC